MTVDGEVVYASARRAASGSVYWRIGVLQPGERKPKYLSLFTPPWFRVGDHVQLEVDDDDIVRVSGCKKAPSPSLAEVRAKIVNAATILAARAQARDPVSVALDVAEKLEEWVLRPVEVTRDIAREAYQLPVEENGNDREPQNDDESIPF